MAPSSSQHLTENSTSVVKSHIVIAGGGPTSKRTPQKLPHNRPHFLEMVPGRRFKPYLDVPMHGVRQTRPRHLLDDGGGGGTGSLSFFAGLAFGGTGGSSC